jgi:hypothetical protein
MNHGMMGDGDLFQEAEKDQGILFGLNLSADSTIHHHGLMPECLYAEMREGIPTGIWYCATCRTGEAFHGSLQARQHVCETHTLGTQNADDDESLDFGEVGASTAGRRTQRMLTKSGRTWLRGRKGWFHPSRPSERFQRAWVRLRRMGPGIRRRRVCPT